MKNPRALAAKTLQKVIDEKQSLTAVLPIYLNQCSNPRDRAFMQSLCYGVLRWYFQLNPIAEKLLFSPIKNKDHDIYYLLLTGLYQLAKSDIPDYAAVSATVDAARSLKKPWACQLLNKLLRLFVDKKNHFLSIAERSLPGRYAHPLWLIKAIQSAWPDDSDTIFNANNQHPPMTLRVNLQKITRDEYLSLLKKQSIDAVAIDGLPAGIQLNQPVPVQELPGFTKGLCYIQDASGQYAATFLCLEKDLAVLDACAAPGSKTTHILEHQPDIKSLTAIDHDPERLHFIKENISRLGLAHKKIRLITADAGDTAAWVTEDKFDRILLDAPCSATGIIRRHPDIKILRQASDIEKYAKKQAFLINSLWPLLNNGGILLYSTCSILPEENEKIISDFLTTHPDAIPLPLEIPNAIPTAHGQQLLPTPNGTDGFYYARLKKILLFDSNR